MDGVVDLGMNRHPQSSSGSLGVAKQYSHSSFHRNCFKMLKSPDRSHPLYRISGAAIVLAIQIGTALGMTTVPASAQNCRSSSYIPGTGHITVQRSDGATVSIQAGNRNYARTAHLWINNNYIGQYNIPFSLADGEIQVRFRMLQRLETWNGEVRQVYKPVPYVVVCGNWSGYLP
jgi:hypothetical protein